MNSHINALLLRLLKIFQPASVWAGNATPCLRCAMESVKKSWLAKTMESSAGNEWGI